MAQWEFMEWLLFWVLETSHFDFEWDEGNRTKSAAKHGVSTEEVEAVFRSGQALPLGVQINPAVPEQRLGLVGPSLTGRLLQIAFTLREGKVRVISAARRTERKEPNMKKSYVKSLKEYDKPFELEAEKILAAMKRFRDAPKKPTSVALDETTIKELKGVAAKQGIPYQVLIRVFILDGLERLKKSA